jgi:hypothetical protein
MVGFCESLAVSSGSCIKPILRQLHITCSGDDCVSIGGAAQPLLQHCTMQVRRPTPHAAQRRLATTKCDGRRTLNVACCKRGSLPQPPLASFSIQLA